MDREFFEKLIEYYKCRIEDDERYGKRIKNEEKDAYRVMKALTGKEYHITIKNGGDLACLLNVAKQLTVTGGRNIFEEFCSISQVETIINSMASRKPEQLQAIQDYDFSDWGPNETPLEQDHKQVESFRRANVDEIYYGTLAKASDIINAGRPIQIKTTADTIDRLNEKEKSILSISKILVRINGFVPDTQLKFENGRVVLNYTDAEKVFGGDIIKTEEQTMGITPAQAEEKKKQEDIRQAVLDRWKGRKQEDYSKRQQMVADKWKTNINAKREGVQRKQEKGNGRGMSR